MSIPKEKLIIFKIREIINDKYPEPSYFTDQIKMAKINDIVNAYEDPGYIGGPVVGVPEMKDDQPPMEYYESGGK